MTIQLIDRNLFEDVSRRAEGTARRRLNHNFHSGAGDNPHRFLNVLLRGTYVRPHRHLDPPKSETFVVLEGRAEVLIFNDDGTVASRHPLGEETLGIDLGPGIWHTVLALSDRVICFEVKPGPWAPASDKEFASWAPPEGDPAVSGYLESLL
jgi:cupin fold WbuC family metalloprotein